MSAALTPVDKGRLLGIARRALEEGVTGMGQVSPECWRDGLSLSSLAALRGAFVTLKSGDRLRGCIGYVEGHVPLCQAVAENAVSAALRDPRFVPVSPDELAAIRIEVSALTEPRPMATIEELVIGRHGVIVSSGGRRGLLLPQVGPEHGLTAVAFVEETCRKAGLPRDAWLHGARVQLFEAEVFGEERHAA